MCSIEPRGGHCLEGEGLSGSRGKAWRAGGQHCQVQVPLLLGFPFYFLRLLHFLSLFPVTPGALEYRLFSPRAVSLSCFCHFTWALLCAFVSGLEKAGLTPPSLQLSVILAFG